MDPEKVAHLMAAFANCGVEMVRLATRDGWLAVVETTDGKRTVSAARRTPMTAIDAVLTERLAEAGLAKAD